MATPWTTENLQTAGRDALANLLAESSRAVAKASNSGWMAFEMEASLTKLRIPDLAGVWPEVKRADEVGVVVDEFQDYMIEGVPPRDAGIVDAMGLRSSILDVAEAMVAACDKAGVRLTPIAHPDSWGGKRDTKMPQKADHQRMVRDTMPAVGLGAIGASLQLHCAHPCNITEDRYWRTLLLLQQHAPLLLALSANSPKSGSMIHGSVRYLLSRSVWSFQPYFWQSYEEFVDHVHALVQYGSITGPHNLHGWVKACVGSIEQRICDIPGTVQEIWTLCALMRALVQYCYEQAADPNGFLLQGDIGRDQLLLALEQAATFGLSDMQDCRIQSPWEGQRVKLYDLFMELGNRVGDIMTDQGADWERQYLFEHMLADQKCGENGATRFARWHEQHDGNMTRVVEAASRHFGQSLGEAKKSLSAMQPDQVVNQ